MPSTRDPIVNVFLRFITREDPKSGDPIPWLKKDRNRPGALVEAILAAPLFGGIKLGRADDDELAAVTAKKAAALVSTGDDVTVDLKDVEDDEQLSVGLDVREGKTEIRLVARGAALAAHRATAIDELIAVGQKCVKALEGIAGLSVGHIQVAFADGPIEFPRARPPRESNRYPERSIVTFIDLAYHRSDDGFAHPEEANALTEPPPPAKVTKTGDLVTVRWARTLDEPELVAAASGHDQWVSDRLEAGLEFGFNELGDQLEDVGGAKPRPPLTLYAPRTETGYKTLVVFPDGSVDDDAWNDAHEVLAAKKLSDGTPVAAVKLIVPLRDLVFDVSDRATKAGFAAVLYPDGNGRFWNPDPPGNWLSEPRRSPPSPSAPAAVTKGKSPKSKAKKS